MHGSLLRLDTYCLDELSFSLDEKYEFSPDEPDLSTDDLQVEVQVGRHNEELSKWFFTLSVRLDEMKGKYPYKFSIVLSGFFDVKPECPPGLAEQLPLVNAPAMLYASAREILAMVTGRARYFSITLPAVTFLEHPNEKVIGDTSKRTKRVRGKAQSAAKARKGRSVSQKKP